MSFQEQELLMRKQTAQVVQVRTQYYESQLSKVVSSNTSAAGNSGALSGKRRQERSSAHSPALQRGHKRTVLRHSPPMRGSVG